MKQVGCCSSRSAFFLAVSSLFLFLGNAVAAPHCFRVYDGGGKLKYEGRQAPVDLRDTDSESWTKLRLRSEHLLWHTSEMCQGDGQQVTRSTAGREADVKGNAALILSRLPQFAGR